MAKKVSAATGQKQPDRATLNRLIRVQLNQDRGSQAWTKFLILIEGGLGTAYGYMVLGGPSLTRTVLAILIGVVGILTSIVCKDIIERTHKWSTWYVRKYNQHDGFSGTLFPVSEDEKKTPMIEVKDMPTGPMAARIVWFCDWAIGLWAVAIGLAVLLFLSSYWPWAENWMNLKR